MDAGSSSSLPPSPAPLRFVIVPWLAFGHLLPYLELASRGHRVSYVSTPRNLARLTPLRPASAPRVDLVALPLPRVDGLPEGAESTNDVPDDQRELHWKAFDGLAAPFTEFLAAACADEGSMPHWIIADCFHHWVAAAAVHHKVPCVMLLPTAALITTFQRQPSEHGGARAVTRPRYKQEETAPVYDQGASGMSVVQRWFMTKERCVLGAIRSCVEWEPEPFPLVPTVLGMPVVPLGLLPPSPDGGRCADGTNGSSDHATVRWLDAQPPGSVVYAALGSEVPLREEQVHELALGLELAGTRFLWALRKSTGAVLDTDILPPGFQDRTSGSGLVTTGWDPQMSIHSSCCPSSGTKGQTRAKWMRRMWGCRWRGTRTTGRSTAMASRAPSGPSWLREKRGEDLLQMH